MSASPGERRKFPRVDSRIPMRYRKIGTSAQEFKGSLMRNISQGGTSMTIYEFLPLNLRLAMEIPLLSGLRAVQGVGRVAWIKKAPFSEQYDVGVEFLDLDQEDTSRVSSFIRADKVAPCAKKKIFSLRVFLLIAVLILAADIPDALAYWIWTPESGKFINPKYAVKDTPEQQFDVALTYFKAEDYKKAIDGFERLLKHYPLSKLASEAQFYIAECYEKIGEYYQAFKNYQLVIDKYPYSEGVDEVIEREYRIANLFYSGQKAKILGVALLPAKQKAIEIFAQVVENAPYGKYADTAQYKLGQCHMDVNDYMNAALAFKKIIENYPKSPLVDDAKYQIAVCAAAATTGPEYNEEDTDKAIKEFKDFVRRYPDSSMEKEARNFIDRLESQKAENNFNIAQFYERQGNIASAIIYYEEILDKFPQNEWAVKALERLQIIRKQQAKREQ